MSDMLGMIRSLGSQLRWAADLDLPEVDSAEDFVISGMGGSGIAGDFISAVLTDSSVRVTTHKGYAPLPGWVDRVKPLVIAISYSGNTEETLSVVNDAAERGLATVVVTTGGAISQLADENAWPSVIIPDGLQPRAALGFLFGAAIRLVGASSGKADFGGDLLEAAGLADAITAEGSPRWKETEALASGAAGRSVIIYGGGPISGAAAQRWKTQVNENAKTPAWWGALPEIDHNEIVGWEADPERTIGSMSVIGLSDDSDHSRVAGRYRHTRDLTSAAVPWVGIVTSLGAAPIARVVSLAAQGDVFSWMLAKEAGVEPTPVETIEKLKQLLMED